MEEAIGWLGEDVTVLEEHQADSRPASASIRPAIAASARDKQADEAMRQRRAHSPQRKGRRLSRGRTGQLGEYRRRLCCTSRANRARAGVGAGGEPRTRAPGCGGRSELLVTPRECCHLAWLASRALCAVSGCTLSSVNNRWRPWLGKPRWHGPLPRTAQAAPRRGTARASCVPPPGPCTGDKCSGPWTSQPRRGTPGCEGQTKGGRSRCGFFHDRGMAAATGWKGNVCAG